MTGIFKGLQREYPKGLETSWRMGGCRQAAVVFGTPGPVQEMFDALATQLVDFAVVLELEGLQDVGHFLPRTVGLPKVSEVPRR